MTLEKRSAQSGIARSLASSGYNQRRSECDCRGAPRLRAFQRDRFPEHLHRFRAFGDVRLHCAFAQEVTNVR